MKILKKLNTISVAKYGVLVAMATFAFLAIPTDLAAQVINYTTARNNVVTNLRPIFRLARFILLAAAVGLAFYNGFEASRGESGKWMQVVLLSLVAVFFLMPSAIFNMLGMTDLGCLADALFSSGTGSINCGSL